MTIIDNLIPASKYSLIYENTDPYEKAVHLLNEISGDWMFPEIEIPIIEHSDTNIRTTSIEEFIEKIKHIEYDYFDKYHRKDTKYMMMQFRKVFYDSPSWNKILIPGTDASNLACVIPDMQKKILNSNRIVRLLDNTIIDIGHVFPTIDAFNRKTVIKLNIVPWLSIRNNYDGTSWVGDLGSVLAEVHHELLQN